MNLIEINQNSKNIFVNDILKWGEKNRRHFYWRMTDNPYHILIAEMLLQKTNVKQVERIFLNFIAKIPTIEDLANIELIKIMEILKPLGLYYRSERLKRIAEQVTNDYNGIIPSNEKELIKLKGIGRYISRTILCFAFNKPLSILDVNIARIFIRYFGLPEQKRPRDSKMLWELADQLLPEKTFKEYNFSLLDFGSLVCKKRAPDCNICPLTNKCYYVISERNI